MNKPILFIIFSLASVLSLPFPGHFFLKNFGPEHGRLHLDGQSGEPGVSEMDCDKGIQIHAFEVDRTTFGFADPGFSLPFDPDSANKKVALGCDSVRMAVTGVVGAAAVDDSIGVVITYGNPNGSAASGEIFLFDAGTVRIVHGGNPFLCPVTPANLSVTSVAGLKTMKFDLDACLATLGFGLAPGDSIQFTGNFQVNPVGPFLNSFETVPDFQAWLYAVRDGEEVVCDVFNETFTLGKGRAVFDFPNSMAGLPAGCDAGGMTWRLFVPDNEFDDFFGNEFRPAARVDSIVFDFDTGLLDAFEGLEVSVAIPGHPVFGDSHFPIQPLTDFPDGHYVARFDTLAYTPSLNIVQQYIFDLNINFVPTCAANAGSAAGNNIYGIDSKISYQDLFYASSIGDGSCVQQMDETAQSILNYKNPPALAFTPLTPVNVAANGDLATWEVQLCNTSALADAGLTWVAIEDPTGTVSVVSIENINVPANPAVLALQPYGQHVFAYTPALLRNNGVNAVTDYCVNLRITATVNDCSDAVLKLRGGWNCGPFAVPDWTPALYPPCQEQQLNLGVTNLGISPVTVDFAEVTSVCAAGGTEAVTVAGALTSASALPADDFLLKFMDDENGDGIVQPDEPVLAQLTVSGSVGPANPLVFSQLLQILPAQACRILVQLEAGATNLCGEVLLALPLPVLENAGEDQFFCDVATNNISTTIGDAICSNGIYNFTWTALAPATVAMLGDPNAANPALTFDPTNFFGESLIFILETQRPGCANSSRDTVQVHLPASPDGYFSEDEIFLQASGCQSAALLCSNVTAAELPDLVFTDNGQPFAGAVTPCNGSFFGLQLSVGTHEIIAANSISGCADTVLAMVTCTSTDTVILDILLNNGQTVCFAGSELTGPVVSLTNVCPGGSQLDLQVVNDSCLVVTGVAVGQQTACVVVCDGAGFCDTTILVVNVLHPLPDGIKDTIVATQAVEYCFDDQLVNVQGPFASIENICPQQGGGQVVFAIDPAGFCLSYTGVAIGTDTACVKLCDNLGNCDTIDVCVTVVPGSIVTDTVFIFVETGTFCLDANLLPGSIVSVEDICPDGNGDEVVFTVDGDCVSYSGIAVGVDTACVRFEDEFGNVALTELVVTVVKTFPETFCDTIFIGETGVKCLDTAELPGLYDAFSFREVCPDAWTGNADFFLEPVNRCVFYSGENLGVDSACVVVCDTFGYCDTTYFCLLVVDYPELPGLGDDNAVTEKATPVVIDFLSNDTLFGGIVDIFILDPPISGEAILNLDNSFTYIPEDPFCARWDQFTYVACNPNGCDTAAVNIFIECIELTVFTAVSPNNDDVNDVFYIAKIEEFPDNRLWVYNRWGSLVFETVEYENNWPGNWGDDTDLPDGTYYFVLEWTDGGVTTVQRGYFEMFR